MKDKVKFFKNLIVCLLNGNYASTKHHKFFNWIDAHPINNLKGNILFTLMIMHSSAYAMLLMKE